MVRVGTVVEGADEAEIHDDVAPAIRPAALVVRRCRYRHRRRERPPRFRAGRSPGAVCGDRSVLVERVVTITADDAVVAQTTEQRVVAVAAQEDVVAAEAADGVIASTTAEQVTPRVPCQRVVAGSGDDALDPDHNDRSCR